MQGSKFEISFPFVCRALFVEHKRFRITMKSSYSFEDRGTESEIP